MKPLSEITVEDLEVLEGKHLLLNVDTAGMKTLPWIEQNAAEIERLLQANGALVVRGLNILSSKQFGQVLTKLFGSELINYTYRSTPRTELRGNVYTATEYHAEETIPQHNENAYSNKWAMRLGLFCLLPAETGGETPVADSREVYDLIPDDIRQKFAEKGVKYVRNYGDIDLPWKEVFQTEDRAEVEQYCRDNELDFEWVGDNGLRTSQILPAIADHPVTGEKVWFNQAHPFHVSSLGDETRESMVSVFGEDNLPRNSYYGDGSPFDEADLQVIRDAYDKVTIAFPWQKNDLILVDNMLYTHGRRPYTGARKVLVGMAHEFGWDKMK